MLLLSAILLLVAIFSIIKAKDILFILVRFENRDQLIDILEKSSEEEEYAGQILV